MRGVLEELGNSLLEGTLTRLPLKKLKILDMTLLFDSFGASHQRLQRNHNFGYSNVFDSFGAPHQSLHRNHGILDKKN